MDSESNLWVEVDEQGRLVLPVEAAELYGVKPGARVRIEKNANHLRLHRSATHLIKVYVEPTDLCNFNIEILI